MNGHSQYMHACMHATTKCDLAFASTILLLKLSLKKHEGVAGPQFPGSIGGGSSAIACPRSCGSSSGRLMRLEATRRR